MGNGEILGESPETKRILDYFRVKYGQSLMAIGLAKSLSVASLKVKNCFPLNIINVSPSGHFKTRTSLEQLEIFSKRNIVNFGSDFTIHGLAQQYDKGRKINNKTCLINDLTLLFGSKNTQAKQRLINALAELLSEGAYAYKNFKGNWELKARISMIGNITIDTYMKYYKELLESTFGERCLTLYNIVNEKEESSFNNDKINRIKISFGDRVRLRTGNINYGSHVKRLDELAGDWKILSLSPSRTRVFDRIVSIASANALLNKRKELCEDDFFVLDMIQGALVNPLSPHAKIVERAMRGMTQVEICEDMEKNPKNYQGYVSRVLKDYRNKGVILKKYYN